MKNGDDRLFIPNRTLLSGGLVTGLLLFLLLVWRQQSIPGAAYLFFHRVHVDQRVVVLG